MMVIQLTKDLKSALDDKVVIQAGMTAKVVITSADGYCIIDSNSQMWYVPEDHAKVIQND